MPDEPTPVGGGRGAGRAFSVQKYGMMTFGDLFTSRQKLALTTLAEQIRATESVEERELLALCLSKFAERCNSLCDWMVDVECPGHLYTQQVMPPAWDFAECMPFSDSSGSFTLVLENTIANGRTCLVAGTGHVSVGPSMLESCCFPMRRLRFTSLTLLMMIRFLMRTCQISFSFG